MVQHLLRAGNDISTVRSWLGHVSVVTTDHYTETPGARKDRGAGAAEAGARVEAGQGPSCMAGV